MDKSDEQIIQKHLSGDKAAFSELVKKYLGPVYNFVFRLVNNRETAEDLTQEIFLKVWKKLYRYNLDKSFRTWLYTIAKNTTFDYLKKKRELPFAIFSDEEGNNILENIASDEVLPDKILEQKDISKRLDAVLREIPPHYRAILLLHYKEDFSLHEVAEILDEPYNTVKSRHQRGLKQLKKRILGQ